MKTTVHDLDITGDTCPITFVKTKLFLEKIPVGDVAAIRLIEGEPLENVGRSLRDHGQEIIAREPMGDGVWELRVRRLR